MARKRRANAQQRRGAYVTTNRRLPSVPVARLTPALTQLQSIEDRRRYHPERAYRPALTYSGVPTSIAHQRPVRDSQRPSRARSVVVPTRAVVAFHAPERVVVCARRQARREVLHALRKTGRVGQRRPRRNWQSKISCRR